MVQGPSCPSVYLTAWGGEEGEKRGREGGRDDEKQQRSVTARDTFLFIYYSITADLLSLLNLPPHQLQANLGSCGQAPHQHVCVKVEEEKEEEEEEEEEVVGRAGCLLNQGKQKKPPKQTNDS